MAKHNIRQPLALQLTNHSDATTNHEGALAFTLDPRSRLYTRASSSLIGEKKFYADAQTCDEELIADIKAAAELDPEFILRLAAYARQVLNMRSAPIVLLVEAACIPACKPFVRKWTPAIIRRADEPAEAIAYWIKRHGNIGARGPKGGEHAFPKSLSRGIADSFARFGEYHIAKYNRDGSVKLRDVLRITRPKPKGDAQSALFRYVVKGETDTALLPMLAARNELLRKTEFDAEAVELVKKSQATWEVAISKFGSKAEVWDSLELPFMAGLRNISNLMRAGADKALSRVVAMLQNPDHVRRSKQLPFRFYSAYRMIEGQDPHNHWMMFRAAPQKAFSDNPRYAEVLEALQTALELSLANVPRLSGRTFITSDNSGSMRSPLSERSSVAYRDVANLMAALSHSLCENAICSVFGQSHRVVPVIRKDSILTNMAKLANTEVGHSTNAYLAIQHLRETGTRVDRIILFSDMQCYSTGESSSRHWWGADQSLAEELGKYRSSVNPGVFIYSVDLAGYGTSQFPQSDPRVALLAGWSEKLLEFIPLFEEEGVQAVDRINTWEPPKAR